MLLQMALFHSFLWDLLTSNQVLTEHVFCARCVASAQNPKKDNTFTLKELIVHVYVLLLLLPSRFSRVRPCETLWTAAHQAPLSMEFSRQEY